jgi:hypothetical protein
MENLHFAGVCGLNSMNRFPGGRETVRKWKQIKHI